MTCLQSIKTHRWLLSIITLHVFVRSLAIGYGLPFHVYGDEEAVIYTAFRMLELQTVLPVFHWEAFKSLSYYPPVLSYIHVICFLPAAALRAVLLGFPALSILRNDLILNVDIFFYIARAFGVACSAGSVVAVYAIARRLFPKYPLVPILAAGCMAGSFLEATLAATARHLVPSTCFGLWAMYYGIRAAEEEVYRRSAIVAGILFGLTFGINYIVFYLPFVCLYVLVKQWGHWERLVRTVSTLMAPFLLLALFAVLIHPQPFFEQVVYHDNAEYGTTKTVAGSLWYYIQVLWRYEPVLLFLSPVGAYVLWRKERTTAYLFAALGGTIACIMYAVLWNIPRYVIPSIPVFALLSAFGMAALMAYRRWLGYTVIGVALVYGASISILYGSIALRNDTRLLARDWIEKTLSEEHVILLSDRLRLPARPEAATLVASVNPQALRSMDRVLLSESNTTGISLYHAYNIAFVGDDPQRREVLARIFALPGKKYVVTDTYVPPIGPFNDVVVRGRLVQQFDGGDVYDTTQTLFIGGEEKPLTEPLLTKLLRLRRFGPVVSVYEYDETFTPIARPL